MNSRRFFKENLSDNRNSDVWLIKIATMANSFHAHKISEFHKKKVQLVMSNHANCTVVVMQGGNLWWCSAYWDKIYLWTNYLKYRRLGKIAPRFNLVWQMQFSTTLIWKISCSYNIHNSKSVINLTDNSVFLWHVWTPWTERSLFNF